MYDIAIIGLGPAGSTLARLLDKKYKVLVIDKKNDKISKCCGGLLSPDAQKILAKFDLCLPNSVLVSPQLFSVRTIDLDNNLEKYYQRFYMNMSREKFDNFLISLIPNTVDMYSDSICKKIEEKHDGNKEKYYTIDFIQNDKKLKFDAKIVIGADGANSIVRNTFHKRIKIQRYVSIQEWYEDINPSPFYSCIFDKKITKSYCWTISKDNHFIIGGAFPEDNSNERFELLKEKVKKHNISFEKRVKREGCFVYFKKTIGGVCNGKNGVYLIGEAAGMISPSSLEGISYAMDSALILSKILNNSLDTKYINHKYFLGTLKIRAKLFIKVFKMPFMYNSFLRRLVMKSNLEAIKQEKDI